MIKPTPATAKKLFGLSGNLCAFPNCGVPMIQNDSVIGQICHIEAESPGGPRFNSDKSDEERRSCENLILLCPMHHKTINDDHVSFSVGRLKDIKREHENKTTKTIDISDETAEKLILNMTVVYDISISSHNQSGGQTAYVIYNINTPPAVEPSDMKLTPRLEFFGTGSDPVYKHYIFNLYVRNEGEKTVNDYRFELEFPLTFLQENTSDHLEVKERRNYIHRFFRFLPNPSNHQPLYSGDEIRAFSLTSCSTGNSVRSESIKDKIVIKLFGDNNYVLKTEKNISDLLLPNYPNLPS